MTQDEHSLTSEKLLQSMLCFDFIGLCAFALVGKHVRPASARCRYASVLTHPISNNS